MDKFADNGFAEIEIVSGSEGRAPELIPSRGSRTDRDEKREIFLNMKRLAQDDAFIRAGSQAFYRQANRAEVSRVFLKQALFMEDFTDDYAGTAGFSAYYPYYQLMNYEQLRTYFTWRTRAKKGDIAETSLSYAFLYIYELLNNIGCEDSREGWERLTVFWQAYRVYDDTIDRYLEKWIRDYQIYYGSAADTDMGFEQFARLSAYDVRRSAFYIENTERFAACFAHVLNSLRRVLGEAGMRLDELLIQPNEKKEWTPFNGALFHPRSKAPNSFTVLPGDEFAAVACLDNKWFRLTAKNYDRRLVGYIMKQTEAALRERFQYKHKLNAGSDAPVNEKINKYNLEKLINDTVAEFYTAATRKVVAVDHEVLERVRREALDTQEKLLVNDESASVAIKDIIKTPAPAPEKQPETVSDSWADFIDSLTALELGALAALLEGGSRAMEQFARDSGAMAEVLLDGINDKASGSINDNILEYDGTASVFPEYLDKLKEMVGE